MKTNPPPPAVRKPVILTLIRLGFTYQEIADVLGCGNSTVRGDTAELCGARLLPWGIGMSRPRGKDNIRAHCLYRLQTCVVRDLMLLRPILGKLGLSPADLFMSCEDFLSDWDDQELKSRAVKQLASLGISQVWQLLTVSPTWLIAKLEYDHAIYKPVFRTVVNRGLGFGIKLDHNALAKLREES